MFFIVLEVAFEEIVFTLCVKFSKSRFHAGDPFAAVVVTTVPEICALAMSLIHIELALVVSILKDHAPNTVLVTFRPVSLI